MRKIYESYLRLYAHFWLWLLLMLKNLYQISISKTINYSLISRKKRFFLDLPKNTFFVDESVKFAGYVFDKVNKVPSTSTVNVYCGIYDSKGKLVDNRLFYTEKGTFH